MKLLCLQSLEALSTVSRYLPTVSKKAASYTIPGTSSWRESLFLGDRALFSGNCVTLFGELVTICFRGVSHYFHLETSEKFQDIRGHHFNQGCPIMLLLFHVVIPGFPSHSKRGKGLASMSSISYWLQKNKGGRIRNAGTSRLCFLLPPLDCACSQASSSRTASKPSHKVYEHLSFTLPLQQHNKSASPTDTWAQMRFVNLLDAQCHVDCS